MKKIDMEDQAHVPEGTATVTGWIDKRERMPAAADCDEQGCILAWHRYQGAMVLHARNMENSGAYITHWMKTPAPPER